MYAPFDFCTDKLLKFAPRSALYPPQCGTSDFCRLWFRLFDVIGLGELLGRKITVQNCMYTVRDRYRQNSIFDFFSSMLKESVQLYVQKRFVCFSKSNHFSKQFLGNLKQRRGTIIIRDSTECRPFRLPVTNFQHKWQAAVLDQSLYNILGSFPVYSQEKIQISQAY